MASAEPLLPSSEDGFLEFDQVLKEERACIDGLHAQRVKDEEEGEQSEPFSLAFSGGGIRAAAFQAGVLWRLAELNRLKDVEYFTAVSGGGYITSAFASHCLAAEPPEPGQVRKWYLDVVARTVTRMQANAGDFVRDCVRNPGFEQTGSGSLPRILDLPILLVTLCCTLLVNPVAFLVIFVVPTVFALSAFYGAAMRAAFCVPPDTGYTWWDIYYEFSPFMQLLHTLAWVAGATAVVFVLQRVVPSCKLGAPPPDSGPSARPTASPAYLLGHAAYGCLKRMTIAMSVLVLFLFLVPCLQTFSYDPASRMELCKGYIEEVSAGADIDCSDAYNYAASTTADGLFVGEAWYRSRIFANYTDLMKAAKAAKESVIATERDHAPSLLKGIFQASTLYLFFSLWLFLMMFALCLMPVVGSSILVNTLFISGPALLLVALMAFVQYSVFGPITKNRNGIFAYDREVFHSGVSWSLLAAFFLIPFYEELRAALHTYYKRCLQDNYFKDGKDVQFRKVAEHPYCPYIILTGTSSDFQPPGDHDVISELSFSALHTGSEETYYIKTPEYRSLAKCTALTGAGCLDAISLSMSDALALRFWLEVLNLSWGDYILFQSKQNAFIDNITDMFKPEWKGGLTRMLHRVPAGTVWMLTWIWLLVAWHQARTSKDMDDCSHYRDLLRMAATAMFALIGLSFFSFLPVLDWLSMSPILRQLQQATKYFYVGKRPPQMLYVTDGGVKDCTALVQLMRRKQKRILLVLAAADPHDDLGVLKAAMEVAKEQGIGCFYDPVDPRRDLAKAFAEYKEDRSIPYLHIGISYCWPGPGEEESTGHLYIVKNRLPPEFENQPVQPLLTPEEVRGEMALRSDGDAGFEGLTSDQLGPFGCCDCCHTNGCNCGPKFPHGSFTGYMYLTPQWSNHLTRLGHALSEEAITRVTASTQLCAPWEAKIQ